MTHRKTLSLNAIVLGLVGWLVAGATSHIAAVSPTGSPRAWGANGAGQLGDGTFANRLTPVAVSGLSGVVAMAGGGSHTLALLSDGTVRAWGTNSRGQLGDGTIVDRTTPVAVIGLSNAIAIAAGQNHNLALLSDGSVMAWGWNYWGQLGDGTYVDRRTPVVVRGLGAVTAVAVGDIHSLALLTSGTVRAWGYNGHGQLGDPSVPYRHTPADVTALGVATAIAAGAADSRALIQDGTVKAWGGNLYGTLGDGTTANRTTPVSVIGLTNVAAIGGGRFHGLALLGSGMAKAWGLNHSGQLGDGTTGGTTGIRTTPVDVAGLTGVMALAAGESHSLALLSDGTVKAWGANWLGQLGDGTTTPRTTPVAVIGLTNAFHIAAGQNHNLALRTDDTTAPVITANKSGTQGTGGWYTSDVTVSWAVSDPESAISSRSGCDPITQTSDTAGTTLTCSATSSGGTATKSETIKLDKTQPDTVLTSSVDGNALPVANGGATKSMNMTFQFGGQDNLAFDRVQCSLDGGGFLDCVSPKSYSALSEGSHTFAASAVDAAGNKDATPASFVWTIDITSPVITTPGLLTREATSPSGAAVAYTVTATDVVSGAVATTCSPASGSTFSAGVTTVACSAVDAVGNGATRTFTVTVQDTTKPVLTLPANITADATSPSGAVITFTASATDIADGAMPVICAPVSGAFFPIATTTVSCSATDAHRNAASGNFTVTVRRAAPPSITGLTASTSVLRPPNGKLVPVTISGRAISGGSVVSAGSYRTQDEYGKVRPAGSFVVNADGTFAFALSLEASRLGGDRDGRTYTIVVTVYDRSNNQTSATVVVLVPHDEGK